MTYEKFIQNIRTEEVPGRHVMKESRTISNNETDHVQLYLDTISNYFVEPEFYANFAQLETIELMQGAEINEKPHYENTEQFICLVDGQMSITIVPHVYRQEVAGGKMSTDEAFTEYDGAGETMSDIFGNVINNVRKARNSSPIDFFSPNVKKYPYWKDVQKFRVDMDKGDCIFVPAFNYYQFKAEHLSSGQIAKRMEHNNYHFSKIFSK